jgi:hypothetical protein
LFIVERSILPDKRGNGNLASRPLLPNAPLVALPEVNYSCGKLNVLAAGGLSSAGILNMRKVCFIALAVFLAAKMFAVEAPADGNVFDPANYPGSWVFATNLDATVTATDAAIFRSGDEVYQRVLLLKVVPVEVSGRSGKASEARIRNFIAHYRPPPIPYTSAKTAIRTGAEKFNCLEFAEDIVIQAESNGIPAEVIGILFKNRAVGHACAGFPAGDGRMLYFDSTPGTGHVSYAAHEARVELGKPYRRADGGELADGMENVPIAKIIPVSKLPEIAGSLFGESSSATTAAGTQLIVIEEKHLPAEGIDYAGPDSLKVSAAQLDKWSEADADIAAKQTEQQAAQTQAVATVEEKLAANALAENERLAAQGDVYGELRMGERYLVGDGVGRDIFKARDYLQRAAEQGSPTAAEELDRLNSQ